MEGKNALGSKKKKRFQYIFMNLILKSTNHKLSFEQDVHAERSYVNINFFSKLNK